MRFIDGKVSNVPYSIYLNSSVARLKFITDSSMNYGGWNLGWSGNAYRYIYTIMIMGELSTKRWPVN